MRIQLFRENSEKKAGKSNSQSLHHIHVGHTQSIFQTKEETNTNNFLHIKKLLHDVLYYLVKEN